MEILRQEIQDLYTDFKAIKGYKSECDKYFAYEDIRDGVSDIFKFLNENYLEEDIDAVIESYDYEEEGNVILNGLWECRVDKVSNDLIALPTKNSIMINEKYDAKVYMIVKLLCNKKGVVSKQKLSKNKASILKTYKIDEVKFIKGFNDLIELGLIKDCGDDFELKLEDEYYQLISRNICTKMAKENVRNIKVYQFLRDHLYTESKIVNYGLINSQTGYKDEKSLKTVLSRLVTMKLIEREKFNENGKTYYEYNILY